MVQNDPPDADWAEKVRMANVEAPTFEDPVPRWRFNQLLRAGFAPMIAEELAARKDIDLHRATELAQDAGPELAYRIVA
jgi:hypothetical protein